MAESGATTIEREAEQELAGSALAIREGRFQRGMALVAGLSSILAGLEVTYEHYRGSYSRRIMYTPVMLSGALAVAGVWAYRSRWAAKRVLPAVAVLTLADCFLGFYFHVRGIKRKPGGWKLPIVNIIMGPPIFAPLLFGVSAYLALIACYMRREDDDMEQRGWPRPGHGEHLLRPIAGGHDHIGWTQDLREGRFQKHMAAITIAATFFSGFEAWYSHYKNNFQYKAQWSPLIVSPLLIGAAGASMKSRRAAHTWLPAMSLLAMANGSIGFFYHARGVVRRPGGLKKPLYHVMYGPPIFAPLLFAACGFLGVLASLFRREAK